MTTKQIAYLMLFFILAACTPKPAEIQVKNAWVRVATMDDGAALMNTPSMGTDSTMMPSNTHGSQATSAIFFILRNETDQADRLVSAECDAAKFVEIHETRMDNDIMMMRQVEFVEIPAGESMDFKPGGYHIMLIGLTRDLKAGEKVAFSLIFENAGRMRFEAEVREP